MGLLLLAEDLVALAHGQWVGPVALTYKTQVSFQCLNVHSVTLLLRRVVQSKTQ